LPPGDDVPDTGQVGSVGDFCISDEVMPAYHKIHTLVVHVDCGRPQASINLPAHLPICKKERFLKLWRNVGRMLFSF